MGNEYSAWNIDRHKRPLGLEMVNPSGHYFFIHAEKLVALNTYPGELIRVKNRNLNPETAVYHHPGEIYGRLEYIDDGFCRISLYFGYAGQSVEYDPTTGSLLDIHSEQHHLFPASEVSSISHVLSSMYIQRERFMELKMLSETRSPFK